MRNAAEGFAGPVGPLASRRAPSAATGVTLLTLRSLRRRIALLLAFAAVFLAAAVGMRLVAGHDGHVEPDTLFQLGGYPLVSALLLLGWVLGRFPLIAALVLMAGLFSHDRDAGYARIWTARPVSRLRIYGSRFVLLACVAFLLSAVLMPAFDLLLLGQWAGPGTLLLIVANIVVFGGLTAFLSLFTRADAWIAGLLALAGIGWHALRAAGTLSTAPPAARETITTLLPPHGALFAIENAFAGLQPIPWAAVAHACAWGFFWLAMAGVIVERREI